MSRIEDDDLRVLLHGSGNTLYIPYSAGDKHHIEVLIEEVIKLGGKRWSFDSGGHGQGMIRSGACICHRILHGICVSHLIV